MNLYAGPGVAVREFPLAPGHGTADYLLYVNRKAVGVVEAKPEGTTLTGVEVHTRKYAEGLPDTVPAHLRPLPFLPEHRRRDAVHQPARPRAAVAPGVHLPSPGDARAVGRGRAGRGARGRAGAWAGGRSLRAGLVPVGRRTDLYRTCRQLNFWPVYAECVEGGRIASSSTARRRAPEDCRRSGPALINPAGRRREHKSPVPAGSQSPASCPYSRFSRPPRPPGPERRAGERAPGADPAWARARHRRRAKGPGPERRKTGAGRRREPVDSDRPPPPRHARRRRPTRRPEAARHAGEGIPPRSAACPPGWRALFHGGILAIFPP